MNSPSQSEGHTVRQNLMSAKLQIGFTCRLTSQKLGIWHKKLNRLDAGPLINAADRWCLPLTGMTMLLLLPRSWRRFTVLQGVQAGLLLPRIAPL